MILIESWLSQWVWDWVSPLLMIILPECVIFFGKVAKFVNEAFTWDTASFSCISCFIPLVCILFDGFMDDI